MRGFVESTRREKRSKNGSVSRVDREKVSCFSCRFVPLSGQYAPERLLLLNPFFLHLFGRQGGVVAGGRVEKWLGEKRLVCDGDWSDGSAVGVSNFGLCETSSRTILTLEALKQTLRSPTHAYSVGGVLEVFTNPFQ